MSRMINAWIIEKMLEIELKYNNNPIRFHKNLEYIRLSLKLKNLELIQEYIDKFPKELKSKIFLKNSFIDKLEKLREKLKHHYKTLNRF